MLKKYFFAAYTSAILSNIVSASEISFEKNISWVSNRDLTEQIFDEKLERYKKAGFIMTNIEVYSKSSERRFSMIMKENIDKRDWMAYKQISTNEYDGLVKFLKLNNFRLTDMMCEQQGSRLKYAAVFIKNIENYVWESRRGQTFAQYLYSRDSLRNNGYTITDFEVYKTNQGARYGSVWVKYPDAHTFIQELGLTRTQYQKRLDILTKQGYLLTDYETQLDDKGRRSYSIVAERKSGFAFAVKSNITAQEFSNYWNQYKDKGYRLIDFDCYEVNGDLKYSGNWIECNERYHYKNKKTLDSLIEKYRIDSANIPGISVAIVENGKMIYRSGFGYADKEKKKAAHGETIYLAGSIAKVIGGTLAVKLHSEKKLRNGTPVDFDINENVRLYLTNVRLADGTFDTVPDLHQYTVAQLCAHLVCLERYDNNSDVKPQIRQYDRAIDALVQIWDNDATFLPNCAVNTRKSYSTNAFTYLAAILEQVTSRSSAELIESEIAAPYGLQTLRAQFTADILAPLYDRAEPYDKNNKHTFYENNSWKTLGGGLEISAVDLAMFGWKVLNGDIVNPRVRDSLMWERVNPNAENSNNGIAWELNNNSGNRIAKHGGNSRGNKSEFRIYRDKGIVIAVMSNRKDKNSIEVLVNMIENIVM